ncbi:hypothetical protein N7491_001256 [Penicillium cf. griseofulvum]|uniref:Uncharacterized protein n=1 Tax=Penicillium cf. griseofulvum TaxID=2972120 RepID=A0A9W9JBN6_9EURO|nr:hypothetical protein N7472_006391 [Penicillium cf. griseofulvum]KAJ5445174.1 hypothetical protein N7491_001256 [Penicillium cf. griseofulvum]KAJ5446896.1 hypothetical protein N7445_001717 [Penicillium cf. griseofulvum]
MASVIGLWPNWTPAANTLVAGLGLVLFTTLALVVLYSRVHRRRWLPTDLTLPQGNMTSIPTWKRSYGLDAQKPYRRASYEFEDV